VIQDISADVATFGNQRIKFNATQNVNGSNYFVDAEIEGLSPKFFEYKSGPSTITKEEEFIREFVERDLKNSRVVDLSQVQWRKDVADATLKSRIVNYLRSPAGREALKTKKIRDLFQQLGRKSNPTLSIDDTDDLLDFLSQTDEWFELIFKTR
jgi:hypothetical protein